MAYANKCNESRLKHQAEYDKKIDDIKKTIKAVESAVEQADRIKAAQFDQDYAEHPHKVKKRYLGCCCCCCCIVVCVNHLLEGLACH